MNEFLIGKTLRIILGSWAVAKSICTVEIEVTTFYVYVIQSRIEALHYVSTSCSASDRFSTNLNPAVTGTCVDSVLIPVQ
jgi:hypothetical protein